MTPSENSALSEREFVVDASALLAWIQDENGGAVVEDLMDQLVISTVNWIEVAQRTLSRNASVPLLRSRLDRRGLLFAELTIQDAEIAADLRLPTQHAGLSLADRVCLALAKRLGLPALTADSAWSEVDVDIDVKVVQIR